ncbi:hypothetical protein [Neobacillus niacini]
MCNYDLSAIEDLQTKTSIIEKTGIYIILKPSPALVFFHGGGWIG